MKKRSFILVAGAALIALAMVFGGCAATTDSSGPTTEAVNNDTIILDKNAVFTIEGVIQAFAEGYNPVYFVGDKSLTKTDVDFLNARSFVPAGKTLVVTTYASRSSGTSIGALNMNAVGETLKIAGNLTVKSDIAGLNPSFALATGANLTVGGNFEVGKLGVATVAGAVTQTSGSEISVAGGSFTLSKGATWTVQRKNETETAPGIDVTIGKDSTVNFLAPIIIGSGDFTIAARSGGVINDAPAVYIAAVITGDENSTATLGTAPVYGPGGSLRIANKIGADGADVVDTKAGTTIPSSAADWAGITTYELTLADPTASTDIELYAGKTLVLAADVDFTNNATTITGAGTILIPEGVTVRGEDITLGDTEGGAQPTLVINGSFVGTIKGGPTGTTAEGTVYPVVSIPSQGLEAQVGAADEVVIDESGYLVLNAMFSLSRDYFVPATAKYDLTNVSGSKVKGQVNLVIQRGAVIKSLDSWFDKINEAIVTDVEDGAAHTYIITLYYDEDLTAWGVPTTANAVDEAGTAYSGT